LSPSPIYGRGCPEGAGEGAFAVAFEPLSLRDRGWGEGTAESLKPSNNINKRKATVVKSKIKNQKKAHPACAPSALRAPGPFRQRDFSTGRPCPVEKLGHPCPSPSRVFSAGSTATALWGPKNTRAKTITKTTTESKAPLPTPSPASGRGAHHHCAS